MASGGLDAKRRKINDLRFAVPFCSQSALGAICKHIAEHGLPENHTRFAMWKETKEFLEDASMSMYGALFQEAKAITWQGAAQPLLYINFLSLLAGLFSKGGAFTDFLLQFHSSKPSSYTQPWTLVAYADEVHPGNMLNSSSRKTWCLYVSFLEFGRLLSRSDMWFCLCTIRSTEVSLLQAGFSSVFRLILEGLFGNGLPSTGVLLTSQKGSLKVFFCLGMLLQDGSAHKTVWANRQDTGSKPCFLCKNIFQLRDAESSEGQCKVFSQFLEYKQLDIASDLEVLQSWQRLAEKSKILPQAEFNKWQQATGLSYNEHALMSSTTLQACHLLKPISLYCFDFMHTLCSHGVMNEMIFLVLNEISSSGVKVWDNLHSWMGLWCLPQAYTKCSLAKLFDNKSVSSYKKAGTFKCSASEVLAVYKPLQYFLQVMYVANGHMLDTCACYLTWAEVLDFLISSQALPAPSPHALLQLVEKALKATVNAGFAECMKPKMHWCLHLPDCLKRWTHLPSCWALERKHKTPRQYGGAHCNLQTYSRGVLAAVTMDHLSILVSNASLFNTECHVVEPHKLPKKLVDLLKKEKCFLEGMECSNSCMLQAGTLCKTGDVVFLELAPDDHTGFWRCCKLKHFLVWGSLELALVEMLGFMEQRPCTQSSKWQVVDGNLDLIPVQQILQPVVHTYDKDGSCICLTPAPLSCPV